MKRVIAVILAVFFVGIAGCASSRQVKEDPILGSWTYRVEAPEAVYTGTMTITSANGAYAAQMESDQNIGALTVSNVMAAEGKLTFEVRGPESGHLKAALDIGDDAFTGTIDNLTFGAVGMPISGKRKQAE